MDIHLLVAKDQVSRIDASSVVTAMQHEVVAGVNAVVEEVGNPMRSIAPVED
jgi:hypothetical protein